MLYNFRLPGFNPPELTLCISIILCPNLSKAVVLLQGQSFVSWSSCNAKISSWPWWQQSDRAIVTTAGIGRVGCSLEISDYFFKKSKHIYKGIEKYFVFTLVLIYGSFSPVLMPRSGCMWRKQGLQPLSVSHGVKLIFIFSKPYLERCLEKCICKA